VKLRAQGLRPWVVQRLSALYMLAFCLVVLVSFPLRAPASYAEWRAWIGGSFISTALALFYLALLAHAWVGLRNVIMDYIGPPVLRFTLLSLAGLWLAGTGVWTARVLFLAAGP